MEEYMDMDEEHTITLNLGSSPDPLLDPILSPPMLPPSRVKKMPQPAAQLLSIARSPRKQMFELDIGNEQSPQRLFVTVEAGENAGTIPNNNRNIKRRLFQSPTPTPSRRAMSQIKNSAVTTTTVPLHGITDDEGATPKKRGRPRKSGTPVPTKPKRQGTPRRVGRPPRAASPHKDFPTSDLGFEDVDATPRARPAAQSPRKSTKRKTMSPSKGDGAADGQPPRKRGRPRKSEVTASIAEMLAQATAAETTAQSNVPVERLEEPTLPTERRQPAVAEASGDQGGDDFEDDIWLNTLSDQPAQPATHSWGYRIPTSPSPRRPAQPEAAPTSESHFHDEEVWAEMHDGPADDYSDAGSVRGQSHDREDRQDTVMGNEDFTNFTRISISELPSMQMNSSVMAHQQQEEDLGEETSLIIERTMDYLRQSRNKATAEVPEEIPEEVSYPHLPSAERRAQTRFLPSDGADELAEERVEERVEHRFERHEQQHIEDHAERHDEDFEEHIEQRSERHEERRIEEHTERHDGEEAEEHVQDRFQSRRRHIENRFEGHEEHVEEPVLSRFGTRQERTADRSGGGQEYFKEHFEEQAEEYGEENGDEHVEDHNEERFQGHVEEPVEEPVEEQMEDDNEQHFEHHLQHHDEHHSEDHGEQHLEDYDQHRLEDHAQDQDVAHREHHFEEHDEQHLEDHGGHRFKDHAQDHVEDHGGHHFENYDENRFEEHVDNHVDEQAETHTNNNRRETAKANQIAQRARISPPTTFQPPQEEPPQSSPKAWWNQAPKRPKRKKQPLSKTLGLKALLDEANAREAGQGPSTFQEPDVSGYNDSFSTIPDSVLIAATPRKPLRLPVENEELEEVDAQEDEIPSEQIQPSIERQSTVNPSIPQSETNRLLTPDETSSPIPPEDGELQPEPQLSGPALEVEMPSSPPVSNPSPPPQQLLITSFSSHMRSNSTETPADQLSSFRSGSTANLNAQQQAIPQPSLTLPEPVHRPSLSPIVRAGQRLQQVTSDPPSPPARDNMLGSPFRGSITKSSQSPAPFIAPARIVRSPTTEAPQEEDEPRPWSNPLATVKNFVSNAARAISPRRRGSLPGTELLEDPFGPDPAERARSGEARKTLFSPANQVVDRDATISATGSPKPASVRDDDAMSWQGESSPVRDPVIEEQKFASPTSSVFAAHGSFLSSREPEEPEQNSSVFATHGSFLDNRGPEQVSGDWPFGISRGEAVPERTPFSLGVAAARAQAQQPQEEEEEEEDLFLLEAQRPTPFVARHAPLEEQTNVEPPRRATIASPWNRRERQDRQRPGYNDENRPLTQSVSANGDHELSLLSQVNENRAPARSRPAPAPATAKKQPAFADLFSPMATLPPNTQGVPGTGVFPAPEARRAERTRTERPVPNLTAAVRRLQPSGNSLFPECIAAEPVEKPQSIPQKRLEIGNRRPSVDLFSPVRKPAEVKPVEPIPMKEASRSRASPVEEEEPDEEEEGQEQDSPLPARSLLPRRNSIFGAINSIPKLFSSYQRPQPAEQQEPQQVREPQEQPRPSHEGREEDYRHASELHTTPPHPEPRHRAASPSKSCIRSPEKGKTPGRVVEFTSSTLSPLTQAERRAASKQPAIPPPSVKLPPTQGERRAEASEKAPAPAAAPPPPSAVPPSTQVDRQTGRQAQRRAFAAEKAPVQAPPSVEPPSIHHERQTERQTERQVERQKRETERSAAAAKKAPVQAPPLVQPPPVQTQSRPAAATKPAVPTAKPSFDKPLPPLPPPTEEDEVELPSNSNNAPPAPVLPPPTKKLPPLPPPPKASVKPTQSRTHFTPAPAPQKPTWTNSHWELLACILQLRRAGQLPRAPPPPPSSSSPLLGKVIGKVNNPDQEHIVLEQWHVDIIHAFKKEMESPESQAHEVERWDELDLARRLFAVILGEQRRREGKVDRRRRLSDGRYPEDLV